MEVLLIEVQFFKFVDRNYFLRASRLDQNDSIPVSMLNALFTKFLPYEMSTCGHSGECRLQSITCSCNGAAQDLFAGTKVYLYDSFQEAALPIQHNAIYEASERIQRKSALRAVTQARKRFCKAAKAVKSRRSQPSGSLVMLCLNRLPKSVGVAHFYFF